MNILIRNIPADVLWRLDAEAHRKNISRQELLLKLLTTYVNPPQVIGWIKVDHLGKKLLDDEEQHPADCIECGNPLDWPWFSIFDNGEIHGPYCSRCATS